MKFKDFYELIAKVTKYEELLKEESHRRKTKVLKEKSHRRKISMGTYCHEVNSKEIIEVDLSNTGSFTCPLLVKKTLAL